jgi:hypothetical protein
MAATSPLLCAEANVITRSRHGRACPGHPRLAFARTLI